MALDYSGRGLTDLFSLRGRTAAVTGGASGIGEAICVRLAELGADIAVGDLDVDRSQELAARLTHMFGVRAIGHSLDVRLSNSITAFADAAAAVSSSLDIWVNNAGVYPFSYILKTTEQEWDEVMQVNLRGAFLGVKAAAERMLRSPRPDYSRAIINIASMTAFHGREGLAHYAASKHGILGLTKTAAREFGPEGIRVLAVAPTIVDTPGMTARSQGPAAAEAASMGAAVTSQLPLGRACVPDDVARVVAFCVGDLAGMMTGSTLLVDAGYAA